MRVMSNAQRLRAEVGGGVDQDRRARVEPHADRRAPALVARIGGQADVAAAADHRHALRRAGAEKRDCARAIQVGLQATGYGCRHSAARRRRLADGRSRTLILGRDDPRRVLAGVDEAQAQLVEDRLEQLRFVGLEVALRSSAAAAPAGRSSGPPPACSSASRRSPDRRPRRSARPPSSPASARDPRTRPSLAHSCRNDSIGPIMTDPVSGSAEAASAARPRRLRPAARPATRSPRWSS